MFLKYWNNPEKTAEKFIGDWLLTGDQAQIDEDGYYWFVGRDDDIIKTSGYRCGPTEIEQACIKHSSVVNAAAIGKPDSLRNEIIKVFIVLNNDIKKQISGNSAAAQSLEKEIKEFVLKQQEIEKMKGKK
ncbi:AMP-dependent synthetase and ligase [Reticulomyxa filosa]|uniref:AMP-dependent synthetase and ligase n=1 Tax=Reticulomyxa filosa TaxID=46433 RepID=X6MVF0_RETFI|nr:AMP-dependent synthetase and ligase [Reticulomyxa filosa]|eukprot:ETO17824.1 AMP-dependent synthetase and ligase [Reticulomyxa filosa]